jgi:hypothetical protein
LPGAEFLALAGVFIVHNGVDLLHVFGGADVEFADGGEVGRSERRWSRSFKGVLASVILG